MPSKRASLKVCKVVRPASPVRKVKLDMLNPSLMWR